MKKFIKRFKIHSAPFIGIALAWDNNDIGICLPGIMILFKYK